MALQGIVRGFCDPQDRNQHIVLIGSGDDYLCFENGRIADAAPDLKKAYTLFQARSQAIAQLPWLEVRGVSLSNVGTCEITCLGKQTFVEYRCLSSIRF